MAPRQKARSQRAVERRSEQPGAQSGAVDAEPSLADAREALSADVGAGPESGQATAAPPSAPAAAAGLSVSTEGAAAGRIVGSFRGDWGTTELTATAHRVTYTERADAEAHARSEGDELVVLRVADGFAIHGVEAIDGVSSALGAAQTNLEWLESESAGVGTPEPAQPGWALTRDSVRGGIGWPEDASRLFGSPDVVVFATSDGHLFAPRSGTAPTDAPAASRPTRHVDQPSGGGDLSAAHADLRSARGPGLQDCEDTTTLLASFRDALRSTVAACLDQAEAEARRKQAAFSINSPLERAVLDALVPQIATLDLQISTLDGALSNRSTPGPGGGNAEWGGDVQGGLSATERADKTAERSDLDLQRRALLSQAPILGRVDRVALMQMGADERDATLALVCGEVLDGIDVTRANLAQERLDVWTLTPAIEPTLVALGITDPDKVARIRSEVRMVATQNMAYQIAMAALSIGLGVAALVATGPLGVALTLAAVGVGVVDAVGATEEYAVREPASRTALDPSKALVDPAELDYAEALLVVAWLGIGLDAADALKLATTCGRMASSAASLSEVVAGSGVRVGVSVEALEAAARQHAQGDLLARLGLALVPQGAQAGAHDLASASLDALGVLDGFHDEILDALTPALQAELASLPGLVRAGDSDAALRILNRLDGELGADAAAEVRHAVATELLLHDLDSGAAGGLVGALPVRIGPAAHTLKAVVMGDEVRMLLCSDCGPLADTLRWLIAHPPVQEADDLAARLATILSDVRATEKSLPPDASPADVTRALELAWIDLRALLDEPAYADVDCLKQIASVHAAQGAANVGDLHTLVDGPLRQADGALTPLPPGYHYRPTESPSEIVRAKGREDLAPLQIDGDRIVLSRRRSPKVSRDFSAADLTNTEILDQLREPDLSFGAYSRVLGAVGVTEADLTKAIDAFVGRPRGSVSEDALRHHLKTQFFASHLEPALRDADLEQALALLKTPGLNGRDKGDLGEFWYRVHHAETEFADVQSQVGFKADNPFGATEAIEGLNQGRFDAVGVEGDLGLTAEMLRDPRRAPDEFAASLRQYDSDFLQDIAARMDA
ncbi:MAG: hypothetical protein AB8H79_19375, partial [Myxococcota bacterium]